jgi:steroid delta-isomerase-like uncharacterized protein
MGGTEVEIARETIECFNAGDWARMRELTAPDCVEEELATERTLNGVEEMIAASEGWKRAFPDGSGKILGAYGEGPIAVLEIEWHGTNTGPMEGPNGEEMPPTGRSGSVRACQVMEVHDGRVTSVRHYFNMATLLSQLGVGMPTAAATA